LNGLWFVILTMAHFMLADFAVGVAALHLVITVLVGGTFYAAVFLSLPIPSMPTEAARWKEEFIGVLKIVGVHSKYAVSRKYGNILRTVRIPAPNGQTALFARSARRAV